MRPLLCAVALGAVLFAADPGGWSKAKWGMTEDQILQAFGAEAVRLEPPEKVSDVPVHIAVPIQLAGVPFRALMIPDEDGKLSSVLLAPVHTSDETDVLFQNLKELLSQKYGHPLLTTQEGHFTEVLWLAGSTVITLSRVVLPLTSEQRIVSLKYAPKSVDLDHL